MKNNDTPHLPIQQEGSQLADLLFCCFAALMVFGYVFLVVFELWVVFYA